MTHQDRPAHFTRIRRWLGRDDGHASATSLSWQERVFQDVGGFLLDHQLDPTPDHYDLAFQYRAAANARLVNAVQAEIESSGRLTASLPKAPAPSRPTRSRKWRRKSKRR
jgi:hypothetical protein